MSLIYNSRVRVLKYSLEFYFKHTKIKVIPDNGLRSFGTVSVDPDSEFLLAENSPTWQDNEKWILFKSDADVPYNVVLYPDGSSYAYRVNSETKTALFAIRVGNYPFKVALQSNGEYLSAPVFFTPDNNDSHVIGNKAYIVTLGLEVGLPVTFV